MGDVRCVLVCMIQKLVQQAIGRYEQWATKNNNNDNKKQ